MAKKKTKKKIVKKTGGMAVKKKQTKKKKVKTTSHLVFCLTWTESERGWGQRPDGYSLHLTQEDAKKYIEKHWEREKKFHDGPGVPDVYVKPDSNTAYPCRVGSKKFADLKKNKRRYGVSYSQNNAPERI